LEEKRKYFINLILLVIFSLREYLSAVARCTLAEKVTKSDHEIATARPGNL